ncbi:ribonuclease P protein component [Thiohalospira sp.]|uniref:ribonuclease P protein component n=1 Tax=Thiohalospira sp. TaxID=3080549 RepID=UPI003980A656
MTATGPFRRRHRLLDEADFRHVFQQADPPRSSDAYLTLLARPDNGLDHPRLGLAIGRKVTPRAVGRNRIKRVVRESFRAEQSRMPPVDVVVLARPAAAAADNATLRASLARHWKRLRQRCEQSSSSSSGSTATS